MGLRDFQEAHGPAGLVYAVANSNKNRPSPDKVGGKDRCVRLSSGRHTFLVLWYAHAYTHHSDKNTHGNSNNEFTQVCLVSAGVRGAVVPVRWLSLFQGRWFLLPVMFSPPVPSTS